METKLKVYYEKLGDKDKSLIVKVQGARLLWNDLEAPKAFQEGDKLKYSATVLIPENLLPEFDKAVNKVAELNWGKEAKAKLAKFRLNIAHNPIRKYSREDGEVYYSLRATLNAEANTKSGVKERKPDIRRRNGAQVDWKDDSTIDEEGNPIKQDRPYNGCWVNLLIDLYCTTAATGGIFPALRMVQFVADGEPLGKARQSNDEFVEDLSSQSGEDDDLDF